MCSMWQSEYLLVDVLRVLWCFCKALPQNTIITSYFAWPPTPVSTLASSCVIFPQTSGWHLLMAPYLYVPIYKFKSCKYSLIFFAEKADIYFAKGRKINDFLLWSSKVCFVEQEGRSDIVNIMNFVTLLMYLTYPSPRIIFDNISWTLPTTLNITQ